MRISERQIRDYIKDTEHELLDLIKTMCRIPAPSNHEERRAQFVKEWFISHCGKDADVYIDEASNCVLRLNVKDDGGPVTVFMAHTDTVFPDMEPFEVTERDGRLYCPGVGDDTTNLAMMMLTARFVAANMGERARPALFVANSGEEGLGNLRGCKQIMKDYEGRVGKVISFDGKLGSLCDRAVGSKRYEIKIYAEGGHSYSAFGATNAIVLMARLIEELYRIEPPAREYGKATYNVGYISGGTSVNSIAEEARMLFEVRACDMESLRRLERGFDEAVDSVRKQAKNVVVTIVGERPCGGRESSKEQKELNQFAAGLIEEITGQTPEVEPMSTDCNIPLSLGIPAIALGGYIGGGAHNRDEWVEIASLPKGFELILSLVTQCLAFQ